VRRIASVDRHVAVAGMPDALDGLRVIHLSDLHVGRIYSTGKLPALVEHCNGLGGDLIAVTGDLIDFAIEPLAQVIDAMKGLAAPMGVFFVPGNHDHLVDGPRFVAMMHDAGLHLLVNQTTVLESRGCRIVVAGVDFTPRRRDQDQLVRRTLRHHRRNDRADLRLLLAHHPDTFDAAAQLGVDLTLSGHTHGGQVKLLQRRGKKGSIGLGSLAHKYPHGLYRRGEAHLHVTAGVGSWIPLRVKCPAEIVRLTLHAHPADRS
jgi:predicted MPP superfamily phosphohydrolase